MKLNYLKRIFYLNVFYSNFLLSNDNLLFIEAIEHNDYLSVKKFIINKKININITNDKCLTALDISYRKLLSANIYNIDNIIKIIELLKKNNALSDLGNKNNINSCLYKKNIEINKKNSEKFIVNDINLANKQLKELKKIKNIKKFNIIEFEKINKILYVFNHSLFGKEGNYIDIYIKNNNIYVNSDFIILNKKLKYRNKLINLNENNKLLLNNININLLKQNLENLFKNRSYLIKIQNIINKLYLNLSNTLNKKDIKYINNKIKQEEKTFNFIIGNDFQEIDKVLLLFH